MEQWSDGLMKNLRHYVILSKQNKKNMLGNLICFSRPQSSVPQYCNTPSHCFQAKPIISDHAQRRWPNQLDSKRWGRFRETQGSQIAKPLIGAMASFVYRSAYLSLGRMSEPQSTIETDKSSSGTRETRKIEIVLI